MEVENTVIKNSMKAWVLAARPKTLAGAAVPIMVGVALAFVDSRMYSINAFSVNAAILCLLFAFIMQIDANFINDFFDYVNGNDDNTR
ncbi:MAG: 1,4-dihydroxy-2-naphthoate octaprenyltransferase, partial [Prevotella sp.]|nr:1,4-dihydroxy-2-naphthoate octaprenyltransferase [Prevotella sp.]